MCYCQFSYYFTCFSCIFQYYRSRTLFLHIYFIIIRDRSSNITDNLACKHIFVNFVPYWQNTAILKLPTDLIWVFTASGVKIITLRKELKVKRQSAVEICMKERLWERYNKYWRINSLFYVLFNNFRYLLHIIYI